MGEREIGRWFALASKTGVVSAMDCRVTEKIVIKAIM